MSNLHVDKNPLNKTGFSVRIKIKSLSSEGSNDWCSKPHFSDSRLYFIIDEKPGRIERIPRNKNRRLDEGGKSFATLYFIKPYLCSVERAVCARKRGTSIEIRKRFARQFPFATSLALCKPACANRCRFFNVNYSPVFQCWWNWLKGEETRARAFGEKRSRSLSGYRQQLEKDSPQSMALLKLRIENGSTVSAVTRASFLLSNIRYQLAKSLFS